MQLGMRLSVNLNARELYTGLHERESECDCCARLGLSMLV